MVSPNFFSLNQGALLMGNAQCARGGLAEGMEALVLPLRGRDREA